MRNELLAIRRVHIVPNYLFARRLGLKNGNEDAVVYETQDIDRQLYGLYFASFVEIILYGHLSSKAVDEVSTFVAQRVSYVAESHHD